MLFLILIDAYYLQNVVLASQKDLMTTIIYCPMLPAEKIPPQKFAVPPAGGIPLAFIVIWKTIPILLR